jgi:hypothetical protein
LHPLPENCKISHTIEWRKWTQDLLEVGSVEFICE